MAIQCQYDLAAHLDHIITCIYWLLRHSTWCDVDLRIPIWNQGCAEVNIGILRSTSHHVKCLSSQQLFYRIISVNIKQQQQHRNLGHRLCLRQFWTFLFYMMTNWFRSAKRGMNASFFCTFNCRKNGKQNSCLSLLLYINNKVLELPAFIWYNSKSYKLISYWCHPLIEFTANHASFMLISPIVWNRTPKNSFLDI